jgi:membrane protein DedA with SNARE-associated domain
VMVVVVVMIATMKKKTLDNSTLHNSIHNIWLAVSPIPKELLLFLLSLLYLEGKEGNFISVYRIRFIFLLHTNRYFFVGYLTKNKRFIPQHPFKTLTPHSKRKYVDRFLKLSCIIYLQRNLTWQFLLYRKILFKCMAPRRRPKLK